MTRSICVSLLIGLTCVTLLGSGCRAPEDGSSGDSAVLATYHGGVVTRADLDRAVLQRPPGERVVPSVDATDWYEILIREIVLDRILNQQARDEPAELKVPLDRMDNAAQRRAVVDRYLELELPAEGPIDNEELRRSYEENLGRYQQPARRHVYHLFLRYSGENSADGRKTEAARLRRRVVDGENFSRLATKYSDSESRHSGGSLGWVTKDQLPPELAEIVFESEVGVPSDPITTRDGVHIFLASDAVDPVDSSFEDVRASIEQRILQQRREEAVLRLAADLPQPADAFMVEAEQLGHLLETADNHVVVLRMNGEELNLGQFRTMLRSVVVSGQSPSSDLPWRLLVLLERRERIYQRALEDGVADDPEIAERIAAQHDRERLEQLRQLAIQRYLDSHPERIATYFETNKLRFSSPLRLKVLRLEIPLDPKKASDHMALLEQLSHAQSAEQRMRELSAQFSGRVHEMGWLTLSEMARLGPLAAQLAAPLSAGQASPPYRTESTLEVILVTDREEPKPESLDVVYDEVRTKYIASNLQTLYKDWADDTLAAAGFLLDGDQVGQLAGGHSRHGTPADSDSRPQ